MARFNSVMILFMVLCTYATARNLDSGETWFLNIRNTREKMANIRFYVHDQLVGPNANIWEVARANITSSSPTSFGRIIVMDALMTTGPEPNSTVLGRGQGLITSSDLQILGFSMNVNYYFTGGKYNGSSICVLGRNQFLDEVRELPIVGGTGAFRMGRGYSISRTIAYDTTSTGIIEHDIYVTYME